MANRSIVRALVERGESLAALGWPVVDAHAHLGPTAAFYIPTPDAAAMVAMMDRVGIAMTGIAPHLAITSDYRRGNDQAAEAVARFPGRFYGYVTPNPHYPDAEAELRRGFDELGLIAIKLHPTTHNYSVADPRCEPIWRFAQERGAVLLCHTWEGDARCRPSLFGPLAEAYPAVRFLLGHSGGTTAARTEAIQTAQGRPNIYLEICGSYLTGMELQRMVADVGAERVIFGTAAPWLDPRFVLGKVAYSGLSDEALQLVLGGNIRRLLSL